MEKDLISTYNLNLQSDQLKNILAHASVIDMDPSIKKSNKELISLGSHVARSLLGTYLYINHMCKDEVQLSKGMASDRILIDAIYRKYNLSKYEIVSKGEIGRDHIDTASKFLGLYYLTNGYINTYYWFEELIAHSCRIENIDYKTLVQEYVQSKKLPLEYIDLGVTGPDHDTEFKVALRVGKEKYVASGRSKKVAQKNAARLYCQAFLKMSRNK